MMYKLHCNSFCLFRRQVAAAPRPRPRQHSLAPRPLRSKPVTPPFPVKPSQVRPLTAKKKKIQTRTVNEIVRITHWLLYFSAQKAREASHMIYVY